MRAATSPILGILAMGCVAVAAACGGDGGGDDDDGAIPGGPTASYSGSISFISLPAEDDETGADVDVDVVRGSESASDVTDAEGGFSIAEGPSGDVTIGLRSEKYSCARSFSLPDVVDGSEVALLDISFDCESMPPDADATFVQGIRETFQGVVQSIEPIGFDRADVRVCVASGGQHVLRLMRNIEQGPFDEIPVFEVADLIEVDGARDFADLPSSDIEVVLSAQVLAGTQPNPCGPAEVEEPPP